MKEIHCTVGELVEVLTQTFGTAVRKLPTGQVVHWLGEAAFIWTDGERGWVCEELEG